MDIESEFDFDSFLNRTDSELVQFTGSELAYDFFELAYLTELTHEELVACILAAGLTAAEIEQNPGATLIVSDEFLEEEVEVSNYQYKPPLRIDGEKVADLELKLTPEATAEIRDFAATWEVPASKVVEQFFIFGIQYYRSTMLRDRDYLLIDEEGRRSRLIL